MPRACTNTVMGLQAHVPPGQVSPGLSGKPYFVIQSFFENSMSHELGSSPDHFGTKLKFDYNGWNSLFEAYVFEFQSMRSSLISLMQD